MKKFENIRYSTHIIKVGKSAEKIAVVCSIFKKDSAPDINAKLFRLMRADVEKND
ncbi:MAG: hypothetical protein FWE04_06285 [Oscillospiraceae bacterium]|nr:hypothetical protein [Oscillospiraceae bacterium]